MVTKSQVQSKVTIDGASLEVKDLAQAKGFSLPAPLFFRLRHHFSGIQGEQFLRLQRHVLASNGIQNIRCADQTGLHLTTDQTAGFHVSHAFLLRNLTAALTKKKSLSKCSGAKHDLKLLTAHGQKNKALQTSTESAQGTRRSSDTYYIILCIPML